ncbi:hypothetical protein C5167_016324 [Papaver somniferum]|nr:UPF0481 protein At3g47200-like isoform X2 [Papaver somniferum]RZC93697.1 hypothetical protein C5167_016324 [Papaver somniferum]
MNSTEADKSKGKAPLIEHEKEKHYDPENPPESSGISKEGLYDIENPPENSRISKVPTHMRVRNLAAYEPKVVSIGPYHHGKLHLVPMENHKQTARDNLVKASKLTLKHFEDEMKKVMETLKMFYVDLDSHKWNDDAFVELMILDGCFLIEILSGPYKFHKPYSTAHPIFSEHGHAIYYDAVMQDLLMVENQIPYLAVETLWNCRMEIEPGVNAVSNVISQWIWIGVKEPGHHILDTHIVGLLEVGKKNRKPDVKVRCALKLYQSNVQFKKSASYKDMGFDKETGIFTLPSIIINERTVTTYLNMVARTLTWSASKTAELAIYAHLLGVLVQSAKDVRVLQRYEIIVNELSNHEAVVDVIQEIVNGITVPDDVRTKHRSVLKDLNEFCQRKTIRLKKVLYIWLLNLRQTHFRTPWSGLSLIAAIALLTLAGIQAAYAILSYKKQKH